jgi:hypothetical protein
MLALDRWVPKWTPSFTLFWAPTDRYLRAWKPVLSCLQFDQQRVLSRFFSLLPTAAFSTIMAKRKATAEELEARAKSNGYKRGRVARSRQVYMKWWWKHCLLLFILPGQRADTYRHRKSFRSSACLVRIAGPRPAEPFQLVPVSLQLVHTSYGVRACKSPPKRGLYATLNIRSLSADIAGTARISKAQR